MSITRRHLLAALTASTLLAMPGVAQAVETVRIGLPTKTYWPTTIAETAVRQKLFEKEGIAAELTIYRGGAETFEAMAAGAADVILDATSLPAAGRKKGVMSKVVANAAMGSFGWQLMVLAKSTLDVKDLNDQQLEVAATPKDIPLAVEGQPKPRLSLVIEPRTGVDRGLRLDPKACDFAGAIE